MATELKLPEVGDNIEQGTVVTLLVGAGDTVKAGDPVIEIETDKAVVEVPAETGGTVAEMKVAEGDQIPVGGVILTFVDGGAVAEAGGKAGDTPASGGGDAAMQEESAAVSPNAAQANAVAAEQVGSGAAKGSAAAGGASGGGSSEATLPEVGDNIEQGVIVAILVGEGDSVSEGDPIVEIETDKAVVEVPSNASGTVESVAVSEGDTVKVGGTLLKLSGGAASASQPAAASQPAPKAEAEAPANASGAAPTQAAAAPQAGAQQSAHQQSGTQSPKTFEGRAIYPAAPSVRRLAREMGVNMADVQGSGPGGRISEADVKAAKEGRPAAAAPVAAAAISPTALGPQPIRLPDFEKWGEVRREDMNGIRKATIKSMSTAWANVPMVTHFDKADITEMDKARKSFGARVEKAGGKLTMTAILMKVVANVLRQYPKFGASLDLENQQVIYKNYVNLGVAVDTENGLLVPVLRDADRKSITEIAVEMGEIAQKARDRKITPDEMQGATFTVSNLGGIGGHAFTPIVNPPQVAILGVSRGGIEPRWNKEKGEFEPRMMLPLSVSYDHRLIDGADAARFMRAICESLEDPFLISL